MRAPEDPRISALQGGEYVKMLEMSGASSHSPSSRSSPFFLESRPWQKVHRNGAVAIL